MTNPTQSLLVDIMLELQQALRDEMAAQGHTLTGKLSDSITFEISTDGSEAVAQMFYEDYGIFVNVGVKAQNIPFGGGRSKGGKSKYIQGLIDFWENRGLSGREAIGAAFATAHVHARDGMPSRASYQYSSTGERTGFVRDALEKHIDRITGTIEERFGASLELAFAEQIRTLENVSVA